MSFDWELSLLSLWQDNHFKLEKRGQDEADILRTQLGHLAFAACATGDREGVNALQTTEILQRYSSLVDDLSGLNNYSNDALKLAKNCQDDCQNWKSSLDDKFVDEMVVVMKQTMNSVVNEKLQTNSCRKRMLDNSKTINDASYSSRTLTCFGNKTENKATFSVPKMRDKELSSSSGNFQSPVSVPSVLANATIALPDHSKAAASRNNNSNATTKKDLGFVTAKEQLLADAAKSGTGIVKIASHASTSTSAPFKKSLGTRGNFIKKQNPLGTNKNTTSNKPCTTGTLPGLMAGAKSNNQNSEILQNIEPKMIELIQNEIMDHGQPVAWDDIAGLDFAKNTIKEIIIWPMLRPDIFTGIRGPPKGILLFGPPGTGKTLIGKCIASQSEATFFSISASSLTSKWVGEGEKMVRALFAVARFCQPSVIFIDEIDSLLTQRSDTEHESSRRIKTEFLVQLDGANTSKDDRILVVGATNRPQELDEAARRRLMKRLYIPLPNVEARYRIISNLLQDQHSLTEDELNDICLKTDGYSGADVAQLCQEAAFGPIRSIRLEDIRNISVSDVRPVNYDDFLQALSKVKSSISPEELVNYVKWNEKYGCLS